MYNLLIDSLHGYFARADGSYSTVGEHNVEPARVINGHSHSAYLALTAAESDLSSDCSAKLLVIGGSLTA